MKNERDVKFTPDASTAAQGVEFTPESGMEGRSGSASTDSAGIGAAGEAFGTGTTGAYNAGTFGAGTATRSGGSEMGAGNTEDTGAMETLRARANEGVGQAREMLEQVQERATEQVRSRLDAQKHRAADSLSTVARTLRSSGEQIQGEQDGMSRYLTRAADEVESLAHYLENRDVGELMEQVEDFARRQPIAFLGGAFTLGVLGARFLKSSRSHTSSHLGHQHDRYAQWNDQEPTSRVRDPERDAVGRPQAPGYAAPSDRASADHKAAGPRRDF